MIHRMTVAVLTPEAFFIVEDAHMAFSTIVVFELLALKPFAVGVFC